MSSPPVSKQTPLRRASLAGGPSCPSAFKQPRRFCAGAADRVDEREVLGQQGFARNHRYVGLVMGGQRPECGFQRLRSHIVVGRVDQVARQEHAGEAAADIGRIRIGRNEQRRRVRLRGFVALEG